MIKSEIYKYINELSVVVFGVLLAFLVEYLFTAYNNSIKEKNTYHV